MSEKLFSGIEAGPNFNCEVGNSPENIIGEARFAITTPTESFGQVVEIQ